MTRPGAQAPAVPAGSAADGAVAAGLRHQALTYASSADCRDVTASYIREGLDRDEFVLVGAAPALTRALRRLLRGEWSRLAFFDMAEVGRNPGRIIAALWDFARHHAGAPVRFVSEPAWPGRSAGEAAEVVRHEVLMNEAFTGLTVSALCLYDATRLGPADILEAERTHPILISGGQAGRSARYGTSDPLPAVYDRPLSPPPAGARFLPYTDDLRPVRLLVTEQARRARLSPARTTDLVLAVGEATANTLRHAGGQGTVGIWDTGEELICQISDQGRIGDPLAGRRRPGSLASGHGLWVIHQVCDLVEQRTGPEGTTLRLHIRR